jgi:hypothetical protein
MISGDLENDANSTGDNSPRRLPTSESGLHHNNNHHSQPHQQQQQLKKNSLSANSNATSNSNSANVSPSIHSTEQFFPSNSNLKSSSNNLSAYQAQKNLGSLSQQALAAATSSNSNHFLSSSNSHGTPTTGTITTGASSTSTIHSSENHYNRSYGDIGEGKSSARGSVCTANLQQPRTTRSGPAEAMANNGSNSKALIFSAVSVNSVGTPPGSSWAASATSSESSRPNSSSSRGNFQHSKYIEI